MEVLDEDESFDPSADFEGDMITVVGSAYHQPIADLIAKLDARMAGASGGYRVGHFENGYCASIIMLVVLAFESYVTRVSYLRFRSHQESRGQGIGALAYLKSVVDAGFPHGDALADVYIVRDSLAHAHLWSVDYVIRHDRTDVTRRELFKGYGNKNMATHVDLTTGVTKHLGLRVLPTSVGVKEAAAVFKVIAETLDYLVKAGMIEQPAVRGQVSYGGKLMQFWTLSAVLAEIAAR